MNKNKFHKQTLKERQALRVNNSINPNKRRMSVSFKEPFKEICEMNQKALKTLYKQY